MTCEVLIMNKEAIALAADSAITVGQKKIYKTANKLFCLSKIHPVGIMVHGTSELMGVPWETIIKTYRDRLKEKRFNSLTDYSKDFIGFLNKNNLLFSEASQKMYFKSSISAYFFMIKKEIDEKVKTFIERDKKISISQLKKIVSDIVKQHYELWERFDTLPDIPKNYKKVLLNKYKKIIKEAKEKIFQKLPISQKSFNNLSRLCINLVCKNEFPSLSSGVVIAGFGEKEIFPSYNHFLMECVINNRLKYYKRAGDKIDRNSIALIGAFAQKEMVATFMEGVNTKYQKQIETYLSKLLDDYPNIVSGVVEKGVNLNKKQKGRILKELKKAGKILFEQFKKSTADIREKDYIDPVVETIAALPKNELAEMAESLVNLTSFKLKVSLKEETVGGDTDVAVISKGDGFIWIKRKTYFKPELNPIL